MSVSFNPVPIPHATRSFPMIEKTSPRAQYDAAITALTKLVDGGRRDIPATTRIIELMVMGKDAPKMVERRLRELLFGPMAFFTKQSVLAKALMAHNAERYKNQSYTEVFIHGMLTGSRRPSTEILDDIFACVDPFSKSKGDFEAKKAETVELITRLELLIYLIRFKDQLALIDRVTAAALKPKPPSKSKK